MGLGTVVFGHRRNAVSSFAGQLSAECLNHAGQIFPGEHRVVRYLIVDDSVFARKNLTRMVETFGGQLAGEAGDGVSAVTEYDRTQPHIVLVDITMPQMEGNEAPEKMGRQHPEARMVMVSGVGYKKNMGAAWRGGARHFVQKPVKAEVLYEVIKYVMGEDCSVVAAA